MNILGLISQLIGIKTLRLTVLLHVVLVVICFLAVNFFYFFFHDMAPRKYESGHQKLKKNKK